VKRIQEAKADLMRRAEHWWRRQRRMRNWQKQQQPVWQKKMERI
jgi:hypothetical protein